MSSISTTSDQLFLLDNKEDLQEHLIKLLEKGKHDVAIFSRSLNPALFNHQAVRDALSTIARRASVSSVRIIIERPQTVVESRHTLLTLSHRLSSKIKIQKLLIEPQNPYEFVIVDNDKLWLQDQEESNTGFTNYAARPEAKRFLSLFNDYWRYSEEDIGLRSLAL
ncbi:MAG: hypothetical protein ACJAUP_002959 [Cellvibrionaceae bacterium]|jgi:hypothetical protein